MDFRILHIDWKLVFNWSLPVNMRKNVVVWIWISVEYCMTETGPCLFRRRASANTRGRGFGSRIVHVSGCRHSVCSVGSFGLRRRAECRKWGNGPRTTTIRNSGLFLPEKVHRPCQWLKLCSIYSWVNEASQRENRGACTCTYCIFQYFACMIFSYARLAHSQLNSVLLLLLLRYYDNRSR